MVLIQATFVILETRSISLHRRLEWRMTDSSLHFRLPLDLHIDLLRNRVVKCYVISILSVKPWVHGASQWLQTLLRVAFPRWVIAHNFILPKARCLAKTALSVLKFIDVDRLVRAGRHGLVPHRASKLSCCVEIGWPDSPLGGRRNREKLSGRCRWNVAYVLRRWHGILFGLGMSLYSWEFEHFLVFYFI